MCCALLIGGTAMADSPAPDPRPKHCTQERGKPPVRCPQDIDINNPLSLAGKDRKASLLYFLERANEELERAFLERRSFIPHLVRTVEEEKL